MKEVKSGVQVRSGEQYGRVRPDADIEDFINACAEVGRLCALGGGTGRELLDVFLTLGSLGSVVRSIEPAPETHTFRSEAFGQLRMVFYNGEPWFIGKDVATALGYKNTRDALANHVDDEDKNTVAFHDGIRGNPNATIINESGLYSLILSSKLDGAKQFKRWVTSEVLPSIRKNGGYGQSVPKNYPDALRALADATERRKTAPPYALPEG